MELRESAEICLHAPRYTRDGPGLAEKRQMLGLQEQAVEDKDRRRRQTPTIHFTAGASLGCIAPHAPYQGSMTIYHRHADRWQSKSSPVKNLDIAGTEGQSGLNE